MKRLTLIALFILVFPALSLAGGNNAFNFGKALGNFNREVNKSMERHVDRKTPMGRSINRSINRLGDFTAGMVHGSMKNKPKNWNGAKTRNMSRNLTHMMLNPSRKERDKAFNSIVSDNVGSARVKSASRASGRKYSYRRPSSGRYLKAVSTGSKYERYKSTNKQRKSPLAMTKKSNLPTLIAVVGGALIIFSIIMVAAGFKRERENKSSHRIRL